MKRSAKVALADELFRKRIVSRGFCQARGIEVECWGPLECAHVIRRWKINAIRWTDDNAACICQRHHMLFTGDRKREDAFHERLLGAERFAALERRANEVFPRTDLDGVIARLRGPA